MPIKSTASFMLVLAALLFATTLPGVARAVEGRVQIDNAKQLVGDPGMYQQAQTYELVSTANVIYAQCGQELGLTQEQKDFVAAYFKQVSTSYIKAFDNAFQQRTGIASPKAMIESYYQYMLNEQTIASTQAAQTVKNNGCTHKQIRDVITYFDKLQAANPNAAAPAATPQN